MKMTKLLGLIVAISCLHSVNAQQSKSETIKNFVQEIIEIEASDLHPGTPIQSFNEIAKEKAAKTIVLTQDNIEATLADARNFKFCVITVGKHTIAKVVDLNICKQSGAWGSCMPIGEGYVQKGSLISKSDYINNIIGIPDAQTRLVFLFN